MDRVPPSEGGCGRSSRPWRVELKGVFMSRIDGRKNKQLRPVKIVLNYLEYPHGSALIELGHTKIICTAMIEDGVPKFLKGKRKGWLTAEYGMLPGATPERSPRRINRFRPDGRSVEIQRLIGRTLRSVIDFEQLGERTIWVDCDVIQADGGTRTAAITVGFVAVMLALRRLKKAGEIASIPVKEYLAAVSVGIIEKRPVLDLCYAEDSRADVDMNIVMTSRGRFVEVQGTAEGEPFTHIELGKVLSFAKYGIRELVAIQKKVLKKC